MQNFSEKVQAGLKGKQTLSLKKKGAPGNVELSFVLKEMRSVKKGLMWNGIKGVIFSGQDSSLLILQFVKTKCLGNTLLLKQRKASINQLYAEK